MTNSAPELLVRLGRRSSRFRPQSTVLVGRDDECDVQVDDPRVSRRHLRIDCRDDGWIVEDLTSTHGTWVDSERLVRHQVAGNVTLRLADAGSTADHSNCRSTRHCGVPGHAPECHAWPGKPEPHRADRCPGLPPARTAGTSHRWLADQRPRQPQRCDRQLRGGGQPGAHSRRGTGSTFGGTDLIVAGDSLMPAGTSDAALIATDIDLLTPGRTVAALRRGSAGTVGVVGPDRRPVRRRQVHLDSRCNASGGLRHDSGTVHYDGYDVHDEFTAVRSRIGLVAQDDLVHRMLTPRQALNYSAMLRLAGDTTRRSGGRSSTSTYRRSSACSNTRVRGIERLSWRAAQAGVGRSRTAHLPVAAVARRDELGLGRGPGPPSS